MRKRERKREKEIKRERDKEREREIKRERERQNERQKDFVVSPVSDSSLRYRDTEYPKNSKIKKEQLICY